MGIDFVSSSCRTAGSLLYIPWVLGVDLNLVLLRVLDVLQDLDLNNLQVAGVSHLLVAVVDFDLAAFVLLHLRNNLIVVALLILTNGMNEGDSR